MDAIIYTTNTGSTEQYAKLLAQKTGLRHIPLQKRRNGTLSELKLSILLDHGRFG